MKRLLLAASVLLVLHLPKAAEAQETPNPSDAATAPARKGDSDFTLGLGYHGPTHLTGSATLMWGEPKMLLAWAPGKLAQVRVGARGAQLGLGFVSGVFEESAFKPNGLAVTLKAIALRTWRDPNGVGDGNTYAGVETDIVLLGIRGSLGYARRVGGKTGPKGRFLWSVGLGL